MSALKMLTNLQKDLEECIGVPRRIVLGWLVYLTTHTVSPIGKYRAISAGFLMLSLSFTLKQFVRNRIRRN